ncbi:hypothetical protein QDW14_03635 [Corynebacterium bovis]|uniref:hypothetical protein n=1 Tax=Corynebacterium bovis TaxID=36808 RepID=UPI00244B2CE2|nr:hypothetical protein [Corynebacterium bovis]MDH2455570.1 hypothetical protein [Corynebacterium bovis]
MGRHSLTRTTRRRPAHRAHRPALLTAPVVAAVGVLVVPGTALAAPQPALDPSGAVAAPPRTQITVEHTPTGFHAGTANEHESRPALSLVKMYIADYVFTHGDPADRDAATQMLRFSDDATASRLYAKYPQSITDTAAAYGLTDTRAAAHWGNSTTSTADSVRYLEAKKRQNMTDPVLTALATASPVAADGYHQDYGTAVLPGVIGTKWGWSDDRRSLHASASFGPDFSVAAATYGPAEQLTGDVLAAFPGQGAGPAAGGAPGGAPGGIPVRPVVQDAVTAAADAIAAAGAGVPGSADAGRGAADAVTTATAPLIDALPESLAVPGVPAAPALSAPPALPPAPILPPMPPLP